MALALTEGVYGRWPCDGPWRCRWRLSGARPTQRQDGVCQPPSYNVFASRNIVFIRILRTDDYTGELSWHKVESEECSELKRNSEPHQAPGQRSLPAQISASAFQWKKHRT